MIRRIIKFPRPSLRLLCREISFPLSDEIRGHIDDLRDTLAATPHGLALASNQVAPEGSRVFVVREDVAVLMSGPTVCINPSWRVIEPLKIDDETDRELDEHRCFVEGCLSIPELSMTNERAFWVELSYRDEDGIDHIQVVRGLTARIYQHECDHLQGVTLYDRAEVKTQRRVRVDAIRNRRKGLFFIR